MLRVLVKVKCDLKKGIKVSSSQGRSVDLKSIIGAALLFVFCVMSNTTFADTRNSQKGIVLQGNVLKALFDGKFKRIKRGDFYGYGWLDDHRIFVAYQQEGYSEAIINAEVVDLRTSRVTELGTIVEADGETNFDVNPNTSEVVFNGSEMDKDGSEKIVGVIKLMVFDAKSDTYQMETVKAKIDCKNVSWVDDNTIGVTLFDEHKTFLTIPVLRNKLRVPVAPVPSK